MYGDKWYYWVPSTTRHCIRCFYETQYNVPAGLYAQYEAILIKIILHSKKNFSDFEIFPPVDEPADNFGELLNKLFGSESSIKKMARFFAHPVIAGLWTNGWNSKNVVGFVDSESLRGPYNLLSEDQKKEMKHYFAKMKLPDFKVFGDL